ncbi:MAG: hypothetical protein IJU39_01950, partial [Clostridia bacterium]|nr:hypothetical protein [Clostridia bacterium]
MSSSFTDLYSVYKDNMSALAKQDDFYEYMHEAITSGTNNFSLYHRNFEKNIDLKWVDAIESCIIPLDNIIRNPRKFIVQEEEIVAIEKARKITAESVRHLAQHTNLIARVEEDTVTPHHILNVFREESFEIYENRFIFTLVKQLQWFIQERYDVLINLAKDEDMDSLKMESTIQKGNELLTFKMEIATQAVGDIASEGSEHKSVFDRIVRLKTVIDEFVHSKFMREMRNCTPVRPPIMRTNVILKNPDFRACLALWQFIQAYDEVGYEINVKEYDEMVSDGYREDLYTMLTNNYLLLKKNCGEEKEIPARLKKRKIKPKLLKRLAEELVIDYDLDVEEVRKIFVDELKRANKKKMEGEKQLKDAIDRAITAEKDRKRIIEERIKAEIARKKEIERRRREREAARIAREKELERQRKERERARAKAKKEKELALEKARREREREKARKAKEREKQLLLQAKEKERLAKQREKERAEKAKALELQKQRAAQQREKERIAKQKEMQKYKEAQARAKQKELEKARKAKELAIEKEKLAKEKAKAKEKERKEKEAARLKEIAQREKAREQERARKAKELAIEKEKLAKEKAKAKEKERKEKEAARLKEIAQREKAREQERARKAKELAKEKERIAREKAKAREKERIAKERAKAIEKERIAKEKA